MRGELILLAARPAYVMSQGGGVAWPRGTRVTTQGGRDADHAANYLMSNRFSLGVYEHENAGLS